MNTYQNPISERQYAETRARTAAFEYGVTQPSLSANISLDSAAANYVQMVAPEATGLHRVAMKLAFKRGYNTRNDVAK